MSETAYALIFYSTGLWAFVGARIVASTFYAMQDTRTPVKIAVLSVIVNIIFSFILMGPMRHGGLAFANAIAAAVNFIVLFIMLKKKLGHIGGRKIVISFIKTAAASTVMGVAGLYLMKAFMWGEGANIVLKSSILCGVIFVCIGLYLLIMKMIKSEELTYLVQMKKSKQIKTKN